MTGPRFLDTNILLYSISCDPTETTKNDRAVPAHRCGEQRAIGTGAGVLRSGDPADPTRSSDTRYRSGLIRTWLRFKAQEYRADHDRRIGDKGGAQVILLGRRYCRCNPCARVPGILQT
jgi:hypothetical protein